MLLGLDLDDGTLEAATSRGLVRRAHRDLEQGSARLTRHEAHEAVIDLGEAVVTLRAGGLDAATCTCPAPEICRHILAAVILLRRACRGPERTAGERGQADPIAEILAYTNGHLARVLGKALLARAAASLPTEVNITTSGATCIIVFAGCPEVRYVAGLGIKGMVCKASAEEARLLRAQALLAVRRAHDPTRRDVGAPAPEQASRHPAAPVGGLLERAEAVVIDWALAGLAAAPEPLEDRLLEAAIATRAGGLFRLSAELRRLSEDVRRRRERDADLAPLDSLCAASGTFALIEALKGSPADVRLRGRPRETFEPVGALTLVGCGYEIWRTPAGARGATAYFYAPAARRWYSASLARSAGQDAGFVPEIAVDRDAVWGSTLGALSSSEVSLQGAAASASGRLSLSREIRGSLRPVPLHRNEILEWPGTFEDWAALDAFIRKRFAPSLRSVRQIPVAILLPARTGRPDFDDIAQALTIPLLDRTGRRRVITVDHVPHHERRLLALEELLERASPEAFFVTLAAAGERVLIQPYAVLTGGAVVSLDRRIPQAKEGGLRGLTGRLRREIDQLKADRARPPWSAPTVTVQLLRAALDQLLGLTELGGQMQDPGLLQKIGVLAGQMDAAGLRPAAWALRSVSAATGRQRARAVLVAAHALNALLELQRLPGC